MSPMKKTPSIKIVQFLWILFDTINAGNTITLEKYLNDLEYLDKVVFGSLCASRYSRFLFILLLFITWFHKLHSIGIINI